MCPLLITSFNITNVDSYEIVWNYKLRYCTNITNYVLVIKPPTPPCNRKRLAIEFK